MTGTVVSRDRPLPVVYVPGQTSVGFEVIVPSDTDAKDLGRFLDSSHLGRGRIRTQSAYSVKGVELKWMPAGTMPSARDFTAAVAAWAKKHNYALARDMRDLRQGIESLHRTKTAQAVLGRFALEERVLRRFAADQTLVRALAGTLGIHEAMGAWVKQFPQVLRQAQQSADGLDPSKWVRQADVVDFLQRFDTYYLPQLQDQEKALEDLWSTSSPLKDIAGVALKATREPTGKAQLTHATNDFKFFAGPDGQDTMAYPVSALKEWAQAFGGWVDSSKKLLRDLGRRAQR